MKTIKEGIVFSNDIERILNGYNALDFNYNEKGIRIPNQIFLEEIRKDFSKDVNKIFNKKVTILSEDEMSDGFDSALDDVYRKYPHCIFG